MTNREKDKVARYNKQNRIRGNKYMSILYVYVSAFRQNALQLESHMFWILDLKAHLSGYFF